MSSVESEHDETLLDISYCDITNLEQELSPASKMPFSKFSHSYLSTNDKLSDNFLNLEKYFSHYLDISDDLENFSNKVSNNNGNLPKPIPKPRTKFFLKSTVPSVKITFKVTFEPYVYCSLQQ